MSSVRGGKRLATLFGALALAVLAVPGVALAQSGPYTFVKLQYPGATYTDATGISNTGVVVGTYRGADGISHAYKYQNGVYTNVDYPGSLANYGMGISHSGKVMGTYGNAIEGPYHAFILDGSTYTSFDYPGMETDARMMNASGQLVGVFNAGGSTVPHGFLKDGDTYTVIDYPGALGTEVWGINDAGVISGNYFDTTGIHGFVYAGGTFTAVNFPGSTLTRLTRTNNLNRAVGWHIQSGKALGFQVVGANYRSVNFDDSPDSESTVVADINDSGQMVGRVQGPGCVEGCGFTATPRAGVPLCDVNFTLGYAGNTLSLNFGNLVTSVPTTWTTYLYLQGTLIPLWSAPLPAIPTKTSFSIPLANVPPSVGVVFGISLLSTPAAGVICADFPFVHTFP